jgi:hypothetical protein
MSAVVEVSATVISTLWPDSSVASVTVASMPGALNRRVALPGGTFSREKRPAASTIAEAPVGVTVTVSPAGTVAAGSDGPLACLEADPPGATMLPLIVTPVDPDGADGLLLQAPTKASASTANETER